MKRDKRLFKEQIDMLKSSQVLGNSKKWVPYLYHFTDLRNVVEILRSGQLLCRNLAQKQDNFLDIANNNVIEQTSDHWKNHVRLYFRPKTPMLYNNEGFRPKQKHSLNAHCPIPIYLMFNLLEVISIDEAKFTDGNLASNNVQVFSTGEEFKSLPFELIYHSEGIRVAERKKQIIFHRHAEVIIPERINLSYLNYIWCRSQAEYQTLQHLLPLDIWQTWRKKIITQSPDKVFFKEWAHILQGTLTREAIYFKFNLARDPNDYGPFEAKLTLVEKHPQGETYTWLDQAHTIDGESFSVDLSVLSYPDDYIVTFTLDGELAYQNRFIYHDIPF